MNANELADKCGLMIEDYGFAMEVRTMLRQQQAEIKELKAKLQLHESMDNQCASLMQQFRKAQEK
jgi:hypothetical protein